MVSIASNSHGELVCRSKINQPSQWLRCKVFSDYPNDARFLIASATNTGNVHVITCTVEGDHEHTADDYLWKEEEEHIVSVRCGLVIGVQDLDMEASPILCPKEESKFKFKMICKLSKNDKGYKHKVLVMVSY